MHSVLVTGSASGIGAGLVSEFARAGNHVVVSDLRLEQAQAVAEGIRSSGGSAEAVAQILEQLQRAYKGKVVVARDLDVF